MPFNDPPWHPITDAKTLKFIGKLGEETTELATAIFRCIIQGIDEVEPTTGKPNREWLEDEIADARANMELVVDFFGLDQWRIDARAARKKAQLKTWHDDA